MTKAIPDTLTFALVALRNNELGCLGARAAEPAPLLSCASVRRSAIACARHFKQAGGLLTDRLVHSALSNALPDHVGGRRRSQQDGMDGFSPATSATESHAKLLSTIYLTGALVCFALAWKKERGGLAGDNWADPGRRRSCGPRHERMGSNSPAENTEKNRRTTQPSPVSDWCGGRSPVYHAA